MFPPMPSPPLLPAQSQHRAEHMWVLAGCWAALAGREAPAQAQLPTGGRLCGSRALLTDEVSEVEAGQDLWDTRGRAG